MPDEDDPCGAVPDELDLALQKKDILVHFLAEELSAALGNVVTSLRLIESEETPPRTTQLLNLALRGTEDQRQIMDRMLRLFSEELGALFGQRGAAGESADLHVALRTVIAGIAPHCSHKGVKLVISDATPGDVRVAAAASRFASVVSNLLRDALGKTPAGGEIVLEISGEPDAVLLTVGHPESGFPAENDGAPESMETAVRLRFCEIAVEGWRGEMGRLPGGNGVSRLRVRVPKSPTTP